MGISTHITKSGRTMIEMDGRSDFYGGALVQGNVICRISIPSGMDVDYVVDNMPTIAYLRDAAPGIRVYEWRKVQ